MKRNSILVLAAGLLFASATAWSLDANDIKELLRNGVDQSVIIRMLQTQGQNFIATPADVTEIQNLGASSDLMREISLKGFSTQLTQPVLVSPEPVVVQQQPAPIYVQQPVAPVIVQQPPVVVYDNSPYYGNYYYSRPSRNYSFWFGGGGGGGYYHRPQYWGPGWGGGGRPHHPPPPPMYHHYRRR